MSKDRITVDGVEYGRVTNQSADLVMVRTDRAGVFVGTMRDRSADGRFGVVHDARRIWYWDGAASLSELSQRGPSKPENCKFPQKVPWVELTDIIEVLPVSEEAAAAIDSVPVWTK